MDPIRQPRSIEAATELLELYATLDGQIAAIEADRVSCLADVNARCDRAVNDLIGRRDEIRAKLQPWWAKNAAKLTEGKRKSVELGGCMIGSRAGAVSLAIAGDEKGIVAKLLTLRWAKPLTRVKVTLDRKAALAALDGKRKAELEELGLTRKEGEELFVLERVQQGGTLAGAGQ